ncbi:MAG: hypothetical protein ABIZ04_17770 [Opitutus sp.]
MSALKRFFLSRLLREKLMLVLFVALVAIVWLVNFSSRTSRSWLEYRTTRNELAQQKQWLASRESIENSAVQAVKNLDPAQTLDDTRLVGELQTLARDLNLKFLNDAPQTERTANFAVHTVQVTIPRGEWEVLYNFYVAVARRSPYIGITQFSLAADRSNRQLLNASLRISSVEIVR